MSHDAIGLLELNHQRISSPPPEALRHSESSKSGGVRKDWQSNASQEDVQSDVSPAPSGGLSPPQGSTAMTIPGVSTYTVRLAPLPTQEKASPPRPQNAWLLYRNDRLTLLSEKDSKRPQGELSKAIAAAWKSETKDVKRAYADAAKQKKEEHKKKYPDYKYSPKRREVELAAQRAPKRRRAKRGPTQASSSSDRPRSSSTDPPHFKERPSTVSLKRTRQRSRTAPTSNVEIEPFSASATVVLSPVRSLPAPLYIPPPVQGPLSAPSTFTSLPRSAHELSWPPTASEPLSSQTSCSIFGEPVSPTGTGLTALLAATQCEGEAESYNSPAYGHESDSSPIALEEQKPVILSGTGLGFSFDGSDTFDASYTFPQATQSHPASAPSHHGLFSTGAFLRPPFSTPLLPSPLSMPVHGVALPAQEQYAAIESTSLSPQMVPHSPSEPNWWPYRHVRVREDHEGIELNDFIGPLHGGS